MPHSYRMSDVFIIVVCACDAWDDRKFINFANIFESNRKYAFGTKRRDEEMKLQLMHANGIE